MGNDNKKIKYSNEEIINIAQKIYDDYSFLMIENKLPIRVVLNLAKLLEEHDIKEEDKLMALECATRIKYELIKAIDIDYNLGRNHFYYRFKKNDFIIKMTLLHVNKLNKEFILCFPDVVQHSLNSAYYKLELISNGKSRMLTNENISKQ